MKKSIIILLCILMATVFVPACSMGATDSYAPSGSLGNADRNFSQDFIPLPEAAPMPDADFQFSLSTGGGSDYKIEAPGISDNIDYQDSAPITAPEIEGLSEKIIYSLWADVETRNYDETITKVNSLISAHGAFIEDSNERGINLASAGSGYRYAYFKIRVPANQLNSMRENLGNLGNIVSQGNNATNITSQFLDTEARKNSLLVQEERILDMLSKVEELADLILLEQHLTNIRYQIESLTSTLNHWQRQVDYSTLTLNISEVEEFTEFVPIHRSYWEQMGDGLTATLRSVGSFFTGIFMWLVVSAPVLLILIVIALLVFFITRAKIRAYFKKRAALYAGAVNNQVHNSPQGDN